MRTKCPHCGYEPNGDGEVERPSHSDRLRALDMMGRYGLGTSNKDVVVLEMASPELHAGLALQAQRLTEEFSGSATLTPAQALAIVRSVADEIWQ